MNIHRLMIAIAALVAGGILAVGAAASDDETRKRGGFERERVYAVPVQPSEGPGFEVRHVVVEGSGRRFKIAASAGVVRESQNRIRLRGVPVIGRVFMDRLSEADFAPGKAVGDVYLEENTLWVELGPGYYGDGLGPVVIVHDKFSYRFQGQPSGGVVGETARDRAVGKAYVRDGALLVLIRPSLITDSLL